MARNSVYFCVSLLVFILATDCLPVGAQNTPLIRIGSSQTSERSIQAAKAVCELMDRARKRYNFDCRVEEKETPDDALKGLEGGELEAAVLDLGSDWQPGKESSGLRTLFVLDGQPLTILVRKDNTLESGNTLNNRNTRIRNWNRADNPKAFEGLESYFSNAKFVPPKDVAQDADRSDPRRILCDQDQIDENERVVAVFLFAAHPSPLVRTAIDDCAKLVGLSDITIKGLSNVHKYYSKSTIPANMYKGTDTPIETVAVGTTFFVSWDHVDLHMMYAVVSTVFDNFRRFQVLYPPVDKFNLERKEEQDHITKEFQSVKRHLGAEKYFAEKGWVSPSVYIVIASFEDPNLANELKSELEKLDQWQAVELKLDVRATYDGDHAVIVNQELQKPATVAVLKTLRDLGLGIEGELMPTALFAPKKSDELKKNP